MKTSPKKSKLNDININTQLSSNKTFTSLLTAIQPKLSDFSDNERSISSSDILPISSPTTAIIPNHFSHKTPKVQVYEVLVQDLEFNPKHLSIFEGCMVHWNIKENKSSHQSGIYFSTNRDIVIAIPDLDVESELLSKGESFEYTFLTAGTYDVVCANYPRMKSTIEVHKEQNTHFSHKILENEIRNRGLWKTEREIEEHLGIGRSKNLLESSTNERYFQDSPPQSLTHFESDDPHTDAGVKELIKELNQSGQKPKTPYPRAIHYDLDADEEEEKKSIQNFAGELNYDEENSRGLDDSHEFSDGNQNERINEFWRIDFSPPPIDLGIDQAEKKGLTSSPLILRQNNDRTEEEKLLYSINEVESKPVEPNIMLAEVSQSQKDSTLQAVNTEIENRDDTHSEKPLESNTIDDALKDRAINEEREEDDEQEISEREKENIVELQAPKKKSKKSKKRRLKMKLEQKGNLQTVELGESQQAQTENNSINDLDKIVKFNEETNEAQITKEQSFKSPSQDIELKEMPKTNHKYTPITTEVELQVKRSVARELANSIRQSISGIIQLQASSIISDKEEKKTKRKRNKKKGTHTVAAVVAAAEDLIDQIREPIVNSIETKEQKKLSENNEPVKQVVEVSVTTNKALTVNNELKELPNQFYPADQKASTNLKVEDDEVSQTKMNTITSSKIEGKGKKKRKYKKKNNAAVPTSTVNEDINIKDQLRASQGSIESAANAIEAKEEIEEEFENEEPLEQVMKIPQTSITEIRDDVPEKDSEPQANQTENFHTFIKRVTSEYVASNRNKFRTNKKHRGKRKENNYYDEEELDTIESLKIFLSNSRLSLIL